MRASGLAMTLGKIDLLHVLRGQSNEARACFRKCKEIIEKLIMVSPSDVRLKKDLAEFAEDLAQFGR